MESIEKLREMMDYVREPGCNRDMPGAVWVRIDTMQEYADEIEREIAERYMPLPVDRKNEPWRIGDKFAFSDGSGRKRICTVSGVSENEVFFYYDEHSESTKHRHFEASVLAHAKPRIIEDVLEEFLIEFDDWDWNTGGNDRDNARKQLFAKYAAELRAMGVDE